MDYSVQFHLVESVVVLSGFFSYKKNAAHTLEQSFFLWYMCSVDFC